MLEAQTRHQDGLAGHFAHARARATVIVPRSRPKLLVERSGYKSNSTPMSLGCSLTMQLPWHARFSQASAVLPNPQQHREAVSRRLDIRQGSLTFWFGSSSSKEKLKRLFWDQHGRGHPRIARCFRAKPRRNLLAQIRLAALLHRAVQQTAQVFEGLALGHIWL